MGSLTDEVTMPKIKIIEKFIIHKGRRVPFRVFQEPQNDYYQIYISSIGLGLFTKAEIEQALDREDKLVEKYRLHRD